MNQIQSKFLQNVVLAAQQTQRVFRVPASITIAQAILESGWGQSALAVKANNFFGIKAAGMQDYMEFPTTEFISGRSTHILAKFARYASPLESFRAHGVLLSTLPRYAPAMTLVDDPEMFARRIKECGYSTNPAYASTLMDLVHEFDLTQYDIPAPKDGPAKEAAA